MSVSTSGLEALEGCCVLARSQQDPTQTALIIRQVLKHPEIYVFGELLSVKSVQELSGTDQQLWLDVLKVFAYGTWLDYKQLQSNNQSLELGPVECHKLKCLSAVSISAESSDKQIPYSLFGTRLELNSVREIEDLLIDCMDHGLLSGKLDQKQAMFEVQSCMGRDLTESDLESMIQSINQWVTTSEEQLNELKRLMNQSNESVSQATKQSLDHENEIKSIQALITQSKDNPKMIDQTDDPVLRQAMNLFRDKQSSSQSMNPPRGGNDMHMPKEQKKRGGFRSMFGR